MEKTTDDETAEQIVNVGASIGVTFSALVYFLESKGLLESK